MSDAVTDSTDRIADAVTEAICRCRLILDKRGVASEMTESVDEVAMIGTVAVLVAGVAVYTISIDFSDSEVGSVTGRWNEEGLVAVGLAEVAVRVSAIRERRAS